MQLAQLALQVQNSKNPAFEANKIKSDFMAAHKAMIQAFFTLLDSVFTSQEYHIIFDYLNNSSFFTDPASAKYHNAFYGGLLDHTMNVYQLLNDSMETYNLKKQGSNRSIIVSSLFHDFCKIGNYKTTAAWRKDASNKWESYAGYGYNEDTFPMGHGEKSVAMIDRLIQLSDEEMLAIRWHSGAFEDGTKLDFVRAAVNRPLVSMLHTADLNASFLFETQGTVEWLVNL